MVGGIQKWRGSSPCDVLHEKSLDKGFQKPQCCITVALFPSLPTVQCIVTCSMHFAYYKNRRWEGLGTRLALQHAIVDIGVIFIADKNDAIIHSCSDQYSSFFLYTTSNPCLLIHLLTLFATQEHENKATPLHVPSPLHLTAGCTRVILRSVFSSASHYWMSQT